MRGRHYETTSLLAKGIMNSEAAELLRDRTIDFLEEAEHLFVKGK
ncbi:MAG: hypothetical protein ACP5NC_05575 [Nitrososphaeria archaeon]